MSPGRNAESYARNRRFERLAASCFHSPRDSPQELGVDANTWYNECRTPGRSKSDATKAFVESARVENRDILSAMRVDYVGRCFNTSLIKDTRPRSRMRVVLARTSNADSEVCGCPEGAVCGPYGVPPRRVASLHVDPVRSPWHRVVGSVALLIGEEPPGASGRLRANRLDVWGADVFSGRREGPFLSPTSSVEPEEQSHLLERLEK